MTKPSKQQANNILPICDQITKVQTDQNILCKLSQILSSKFFQESIQYPISKDCAFIYMNCNYEYIEALIAVINDYCLRIEGDILQLQKLSDIAYEEVACSE